jgi:aspartate/methionine/tyrosine aminotransferase
VRDPMAQRVSGFGTSIFGEMSRLALELGAINLGQGFPDFAGPAFIKEAAARAIAEDRNQYALPTGIPRLRQAIAAQWASAYQHAIDPDAEVTVTSGATEALCGAILALVNPGDEVIVFEPCYDSYVPDIVMAGGVPRFATLEPPSPAAVAAGDHRWTCDPDAVEALCGPRTRAIVINTPHNPTGKVFSRAELEALAAICQRHDLIAITDEVYDQLVFAPAAHTPLALLPGMWERTLTINSTGKTFSLTGWKIGYAVGPARLNAALRAAHQWITFSTATPLQEAMADALTLALASGYYDELRAMYGERRAFLLGALEEAGLRPLAPEGSYFIMSDISQSGFADDVSYCRHLIHERGVAAIPPSVFYHDPARAPKLVRFCFAKKMETLQAAAQRLLGGAR